MDIWLCHSSLNDLSFTYRPACVCHKPLDYWIRPCLKTIKQNLCYGLGDGYLLITWLTLSWLTSSAIFSVVFIDLSKLVLRAFILAFPCGWGALFFFFLEHPWWLAPGDCQVLCYFSCEFVLINKLPKIGHQWQIRECILSLTWWIIGISGLFRGAWVILPAIPPNGSPS